jgi:hypothetical protein
VTAGRDVWKRTQRTIKRPGRAHRLFLQGPKQREIDSFGRGLGRELGRLVSCNDGLTLSGTRNRINRLT